MKNPFPSLDPKAIVAQLRDPRNLNWRTVAECSFGYQVYRGVLMEYECSARKWAYREYEDSVALRSFRKEFVMGPKG